MVQRMGAATVSDKDQPLKCLLLRRGSSTCLMFFLSAVDLAMIMRMVQRMRPGRRSSSIPLPTKAEAITQFTKKAPWSGRKTHLPGKTPDTDWEEGKQTLEVCNVSLLPLEISYCKNKHYIGQEVVSRTSDNPVVKEHCAATNAARVEWKSLAELQFR